MLNSIIQVFVTFSLCLLVGFACMRKKIIDQHVVAGISAILINIAMPALILISMQKPFSFSLFYDAALFLFVSLALYLACIALGLLICKLLKSSPSESSIWLFTIAFPNAGFMGIPLSNALYGQESLFFVSMNVLAFNFLVFTVGILFIQPNREQFRIRALLFKPPIVATAVGLLFFILSFSFPASLYNAVEMLGNLTTPLSMIIVGAQLSEIKFTEIFTDRKLYLISFIRLLAIPAIVYIICGGILPNRMLINVMVLLFAMPAAATVTALATQYNANFSLASKTVFVTTVLSAITIPIVALLLGHGA